MIITLKIDLSEIQYSQVFKGRLVPVPPKLGKLKRTGTFFNALFCKWMLAARCVRLTPKSEAKDLFLLAADPSLRSG